MSRHGENIRKRKDGRWEARLVYRPPSAGKKIIKSFYGNTYLEANQKRTTFVESFSEKTSVLPISPIPTYPTLRAVAVDWIHSKQPNIKKSTAARYSSVLTLYILPILGDKTIESLDSECINEFLTNLLQYGRRPEDDPVSEDDSEIFSPSKGLSSKSVADIKSVLLDILKYALKLKIISSIPECKKIPCVHPVTDILTKVEQALLENVLFERDSPICLICILSLYTGIRIGEACGLQWKDIDLINETLSVSKTVLRIANIDELEPGKTKVIVQSPKSHSSIRIIPIPEVIHDYLIRHKADDDIYLASGTVNYTEPRNCQYQFKRILKLAGIKNYKFHALRHTFATRCIESGVDLKSLSEIMGHASVTITMQRYVHPSIDMKKEQLNKLKSPHQKTFNRPV